MKYVYRKRIYIFLFTAVDLLGSLIFKPFRAFRRAGREDIRRILLIRADHIGDVIASTAVLGPLKKAFPRAEIDFLTASWAYDLVKGSPDITRVIQFDPPWFTRRGRRPGAGVRGFFEMARVLRQGRYDLAIDLRGDVRHIAAMSLAGVKRRISYGITGGGFLLTDQVPYEGLEHETDRNLALLKPLGLDERSSGVRIDFTQKDAEDARAVMGQAALRGSYAVMHATPGHDTKNWKEENFAAVLKHLSAGKGLAPVLVGSGDDAERVRRIIALSGGDAVDLSGRTSLGMLGPILKGASLFVGVDSGPSHIAAASGIPTVILFSGVNDPLQWAPRGGNVKLVYPGKDRTLADVRADEVCAAIDEVLA